MTAAARMRCFQQVHRSRTFSSGASVRRAGDETAAQLEMSIGERVEPSFPQSGLCFGMQYAGSSEILGSKVSVPVTTQSIMWPTSMLAENLCATTHAIAFMSEAKPSSDPMRQVGVRLPQ
jgi:hypothetical protein